MNQTLTLKDHRVIIEEDEHELKIIITPYNDDLFDQTTIYHTANDNEVTIETRRKINQD